MKKFELRKLIKETLKQHFSEEKAGGIFCRCPDGGIKYCVYGDCNKCRYLCEKNPQRPPDSKMMEEQLQSGTVVPDAWPASGGKVAIVCPDGFQFKSDYHYQMSSPGSPQVVHIVDACAPITKPSTNKWGDPVSPINEIDDDDCGVCECWENSDCGGYSWADHCCDMSNHACRPCSDPIFSFGNNINTDRGPKRDKVKCECGNIRDIYGDDHIMTQNLGCHNACCTSGAIVC